ncbi:MAG: hypothetical protein Q4G10_02395 [Bacteroidia bacterium]|nr:hypothetical protein [Bacteroidia bacterium]
MRKFGIISLSLCVLASAAMTGCKDTVYAGRNTVPYVSEVLYGEGGERDILDSFDPHDSKGSITLVGPYDSCLTAGFIYADDLDNIDASPDPDGLPDFSGERIDVLDDAANSPYRFGTDEEKEALRTLAVRNFILAMDNKCSLGDFDEERLQEKSPAKLVVFTSPLNALYGEFDVDTLCTIAGCNIPVVYPSRTVFARQLDRGIEHLHIAVITDSITAASGVYPQIFNEISRDKGILGTGCVAFTKDSVMTINSILSGYRTSGGDMPVSALVIDDPSLSVEELNESLEQVLSVQNEANLNARKLITKDFVIVDMRKTVTDECYRILRKNNVFTHNIAYPVSKQYITVKASGKDGYNLVEKD